MLSTFFITGLCCSGKSTPFEEWASQQMAVELTRKWSKSISSLLGSSSIKVTNFCLGVPNHWDDLSRHCTLLAPFPLPVFKGPLCLIWLEEMQHRGAPLYGWWVITHTLTWYVHSRYPWESPLRVCIVQYKNWTLMSLMELQTSPKTEGG